VQPSHQRYALRLSPLTGALQYRGKVSAFGNVRESLANVPERSETIGARREFYESSLALLIQGHARASPKCSLAIVAAMLGDKKKRDASRRT
jgi:hypothetical protein